MIVLKNISHIFGEKKVLENLNISITKGTIHTLVGVSGVGKTLTLRLISSLELLQSGDIEGRPKNIGYAFQNSNLLPWLTVLENLKLCSKNFNLIDELLEEFRLDEYKHFYPRELSGGMGQKVNVIRSFLNNPELILMDEPFAHLDNIQKEQLHLFLLQIWKKYRPTIVFVTHDIDEALLLSNRISLYSLKTRNVTQTIELDETQMTTQEELKNHPNYIECWNKINSHLHGDLTA